MIRHLFQALWKASPALAPRTHDPVLEATQKDLLEALDNRTLDGDRIIDAMRHIRLDLFPEMEPMIKCRMMGVLSDEIRTIEMNPSAAAREQQNGYRLDMISMGQALAVSTPMPEPIVQRMRMEEHAFMEEYKTGLEKTRGNSDFAPDADLADHLEIRVKKFNDMFARHFGTRSGVDTEFFHDPETKVTGLTDWNPFAGKPVLSFNTAKVSRAKDLPVAAVTLAHEGVHGLARYLWDKYPDPEKHREKEPDFYMFMRLTDTTFYTSSDKEVYRKHPEENLAERIGLRMGVQIAKAHGFPLDVEAFAFSAKIYPTKEVIREVEQLLKEDERERGRQLQQKAPFMYS